ncbi:MAG: hypothetical protein U0531_20545 [Dehalococcoidia bacterium]
MVLFLSLVALAAPLIAPYDPLEFHSSDTFQAPNRAYPLGADEKGRDILSRVVYGARISLRVGAIAVGFGALFGMVDGLRAGATAAASTSSPSG